MMCNTRKTYIKIVKDVYFFRTSPGDFDEIMMVKRASNLIAVVETKVECRARCMTRENSSNDPSIMERLTSVTDLVIDLKGSSCWASSWS